MARFNRRLTDEGYDDADRIDRAMAKDGPTSKQRADYARDMLEFSRAVQGASGVQVELRNWAARTERQSLQMAFRWELDAREADRKYLTKAPGIRIGDKVRCSETGEVYQVRPTTTMRQLVYAIPLGYAEKEYDPAGGAS